MKKLTRFIGKMLFYCGFEPKIVAFSDGDLIAAGYVSVYSEWSYMDFMFPVPFDLIRKRYPEYI